MTDCVSSTVRLDSPGSNSETDKISFRPYAPIKKRAVPEDLKSDCLPLDLSSKRPVSPSFPNYPRLPGGDQWYQNAAALSQWYAQLYAAQDAYYASVLSSALPVISPPRPKLPTKRPAPVENIPVLKHAKTDKIDTKGEALSSSASKGSLSSSNETDFLCSCGKNFVSLYHFTVHLKHSGHRSVTYQRDKDIPKLVRGQDMWINSEIEQTREILRCIRCKRSFKTLPDLTMHMVETKHFAEIVYSEQRCAEPSLKPQRTEPRKNSKPEVHEADSSQSVLLKIQDLVESSVGKRSGVFQEVLHAFDAEKQEEDALSNSSSPEVQSYLSPDHITSSPENPLSSLQKLVETTEVTSSSSQLSITPQGSTPPQVKEEKISPKSPTTPTVIMFNPTYVYQHPMYPMCPSLPLFGAGMGSLEEKPVSPKSADTEGWDSSIQLLQKKAKCNFCSKPFANKGQVRLHISKGKCPSLLRRTGPPYLAYLRPEDRFMHLHALDKLMKETPPS